MRAHYCWREVCSVTRLLQQSEGTLDEFSLPGTGPVYPANRPVVVRHMNLDVQIDPEAETLDGRATFLVVPVVDEVKSVRFDAAGFEVSAVYIQGVSESARFEADGRHLDIQLWEPLARNEPCAIVVVYRVEKPRLGLYFVKPDASAPERPIQVWSQNQDDDARFWFPCMDAPGQKMMTSMTVTVPLAYRALSNGVETSPEPTKHWQEGWHTFHWSQATPHPVYLVTLVIGPFVEHQEEGDGVDVRWYALPGKEAAAQRAFAKTRAMIDFFEDYLQVAYPWPRYGQVAVSEFTFGGMENTTLTTVTERVLPDERASLDFSADSLVAHELAHQWFGDLVTCRDWAHGWLNEGFATYFDALFREHDQGGDEFHYELFRLAASYFTEDDTRYRRPLVTRCYDEPIDLFDRTLYHKGAWVLHMLRAKLGESMFRRGVSLYLARFAHGQAETHDLRRALEDSSGYSLGRFFDEWVYRAGVPTVTWRMDTADLDGGFAVEIQQQGPEDASWRLETTLLVKTAQAEHRIPVVLGPKTRTVVLPGVDSAPEMVVLDPDYTVLCKMKMDVGVPLLDACLTGAPSVARRIDAARALGKKSSFVAFKALRTALTKQPFWGIRREVAQVLGAVGTTQAAEALVTALATEKHPKVRRGIVMALGGFRGSTLADTTLRTLFEAGDPSYFVESETLISLGRLAGPDLVSFLEKGLERDSFNDVIRCGAIEGLSHARGRRAYDLLSAHIGGEHSTLVRVAAIAGLGVLGRDDSELRPDVLRTLIRLRSEEGLRLQLATVTALQQVGGSEAIAAIDGMPTDGVDGRVKRRVREARRQVRRTLDHTGAFGQLRDEMDSMRVANRALRSRLDRLEK